MRFHNINIRNILSEALNYGGIIVDVRTSEEFAKSHIPMAINLPLEEIQAGNISLPKGFPFRPALVGGILKDECRAVLADFFRTLRS